MTARRSSPLDGVPLLADLGPIDGASVLVRVDFNVPVEANEPGPCEVVDDFRIRMALPTLEWLVTRGARVTAASHLGRPAKDGRERCSMEPVRRSLAALAPKVVLLENLRFDPGEEANDPAFVDRLVDGFDAYVNEAFGVAHRAHASIVGPPRRLPSAAGIRLAEEVEVLGRLLDEPERPFVAVVGGAKVHDKLGVLHSLADKADVLLIGGAMAFTFFAALGRDVGASLLDEGQIESCRLLLQGHPNIVLPTDVLALEPGGVFGSHAPGVGPRSDTKVVGQELPYGWKGLDIGPDTAEAFAATIAGARTVFWNGPLGANEDERFASGTRRVAEAVADCPGYTMVGGGDSAMVVDTLGLADRIDFVSTGGGASLALIEHGDLPALAALRAAPNAPGVKPRR
ncbi:MAG TPA: phosphoglycerate kinase [Acidimicrobiales bacterium]|nr:phosphoglycerate kinase [Acidimicrobiales bacterium]